MPTKPDTVSTFMRGDLQVVKTPQGPVYSGSIAHQLAKHRDRNGASAGDHPSGRLKGIGRQMQSCRVDFDQIREQMRLLTLAGLAEMQALPPGNRKLTHDLQAIFRSMGRFEDLHRQYRDVIDELESVFTSVGSQPEVVETPDAK